MTLGWWRSEGGQAGTDLCSGRSRWNSICCFRPLLADEKVSAVYLSLVLDRTVQLWRRALSSSASKPWSSPSLLELLPLLLSDLSQVSIIQPHIHRFHRIHHWLSWEALPYQILVFVLFTNDYHGSSFDIIIGFIMTNIPIITLQERKWKKTCSKCNECKWPQYGNEINNCAFCIANNFQASQNSPKCPKHTSNSRSIFLDLRLVQTWLLCFAGYCCGRKCQKEESNVPYAGTKKCKRPLILIPHSSFLVPDSSFLVPDSWFLIPHSSSS